MENYQTSKCGRFTILNNNKLKKSYEENFFDVGAF